MVDRHAKYLTVPVDHGIQLDRGQPEVLQLRRDGDFGFRISQILRIMAPLRAI
jgi:hypothetical protein